MAVHPASSSLCMKWPKLRNLYFLGVLTELGWQERLSMFPIKKMMKRRDMKYTVPVYSGGIGENAPIIRSRI